MLFANLPERPGSILLFVRCRGQVESRCGISPTVERLKAMKGTPHRRRQRAASAAVVVLFALAGMDADRDIQMKIVPAEGQIAARLMSGAVDALYTHTPFLEDALVAHGGLLLVNQSAGEVVPQQWRDSFPGGDEAISPARTRKCWPPRRARSHARRRCRTDAAAVVKALLKAGIPAPTPKHHDDRRHLPRGRAGDAAGVSLGGRAMHLYPGRGRQHPTSRGSTSPTSCSPSLPTRSRTTTRTSLRPRHYITSTPPHPASRCHRCPTRSIRIDIRNRQALTVNQAIGYSAWRRSITRPWNQTDLDWRFRQPSDSRCI